MSTTIHRTRMLVLGLAILLLSGGTAYGVNQIRLGCPVTMNPIVPGDSVSISVYITNDTVLEAFTFGFKWNNPNVKVSSTDLTGSVLTSQQIASGWNQGIRGADTLYALFGWSRGVGASPFSRHLNEVLLFSINVVVLDGATPACVNFDSTFVPPALWFKFYPLGGSEEDSFTPDYVDCGVSEIILGGIQCSVDHNPPVAICHDVSVISDTTCHAYASIDNGSFDPDPGDGIALRQIPAGPYIPGGTLVSLIATDYYGAADTCLAIVHVQGVPGCPEQYNPPVAICHDVFVSSDGTCHANASIDNGSYDPDSGNTITLRQVPAGPYPVGSTPVSLFVTDYCGAADGCQAVVHVRDGVSPIISCPSNITKDIPVGQSRAIVYFLATATDACDLAPTIVATPPSGSFFPVGTTSVTAIATDASGIADTCQFSVQVNEVAFICGDANGDVSVDISDAVYLIAYIFSGGSAPDPLVAGDANCDLAVDISDAVYLIAYIFSGGSAPCAGCW